MSAQLAPAPTAGLSTYAPGIYPHVPAEVYHRRELGVVNNGALKILATKTPAHYRAWVDATEDSDTPALAFGRALHCAVLEPAVYAATYCEPVEHPYRRPSSTQRNAKKPSDETRAAIAYWDAWERDNAGKVEISADDAQRIAGMREAVMAHPVAGKFFTSGVSEATAVWTDPRTGLLCKSRMDYWREDLVMIGDLKSTEDASSGAFARSVAKFAYHIQDAHYSGGVHALLCEMPRFLFCAVEKEPPYSVGVYMLDLDAQVRGAELRDRAMDTLDDCLRTDEWPGLPTVVSTLSMPAYAFYD